MRKPIPANTWLTLACSLLLALTAQCTDAKDQAPPDLYVAIIAQNQSWGERMAASIMKQNPKAWQLEERESPKWSYTHGLVSQAFLRLWETTDNKKYYQYAQGYADDLINQEGEILNYKIEDFNLDNLNAGKILFQLYQETKDPRYQKAMDTLRHQLEWQPRNTQGGFWHKLRYPWQMWLDGLYMGAPYYAQYAQEYHQPEAFDDIAHQFIVMERFSRDAETGLLYHGWDESKVQKWANPETGCSPNFWGRAIGWYAMGLTEVLDFFPEDHPQRQELIAILNRIATSMRNFQDEKTGLWYQVVNMAGREDNYLEASVSSMFAYTYLKGARKGYLDDSYFTAGKKAFDGLIENLVEVNATGEVQLQQCCAVAGLGGEPYRDGTYDYYVHETIRSNDPKATGPFIMASIELELAKSGTDE